MAGEVRERKKTEDQIRELEKRIYTTLRSEVGIHKSFLDAYGLDRKLFMYYFHSSPVWTPRKEKFIRKLIKMIKKEYPGLHEIVEELEDYLKTIRQFGKKRRK